MEKTDYSLLKLQEEHFFQQFLEKKLGIPIIRKLMQLTAADQKKTDRPLSSSHQPLGETFPNMLLLARIIEQMIFGAYHPHRFHYFVSQNLGSNAYIVRNSRTEFTLIMGYDLLMQTQEEGFRFVIAHELAHIYFNHIDFSEEVYTVHPMLFCKVYGAHFAHEIKISSASSNDADTRYHQPVPIIENIFFLQQKLTEMSADFLALCVTQNLPSALQAIASSHDSRFVSGDEFDKEGYERFLEEELDRYQPEDLYRNISHPPEAIRGKALLLFARSAFYQSFIGRNTPSLQAHHQEFSREFKRLLYPIFKYPQTELEMKEAEFLLAAGIRIIHTHKEDTAIKEQQLANILARFHYFPFRLMDSFAQTGLDKQSKLLRKAADFFRRQPDSDEIQYRLAGQMIQIALKDNHLDDQEADMLLQIASRHLDIPKKSMARMILSHIHGLSEYLNH